MHRRRKVIAVTLLRGLWLRDFLPALVLFLAAILSTMSMTYWQGAPGTSWRMRIMQGSVAYCWDTDVLWRLTPPSAWTLGTDMSFNGRRISLECQWLGLRPMLDEAFAPIVIQFGHIQVPTLYLALAAAIPPLTVMLMRRRRIPAWACKRCRYDLRGLPDGKACPECGAARPA